MTSNGARGVVPIDVRGGATRRDGSTRRMTSNQTRGVVPSTCVADRPFG